jgi:hypothetical protein
LTRINPAALTEQLLGLSEAMSALAETCAGYREQCKAAGFTLETAELMALQLHQNLLDEVDRLRHLLGPQP